MLQVGFNFIFIYITIKIVNKKHLTNIIFKIVKNHLNFNFQVDLKLNKY